MGTTICITGMHRSGTSLSASWLERCGLPIHAGRLITPAEGNPKGHFEDLDMARLQAQSLQRRGLGSVGWGLRGDRFLDFDPGERARAADLVAERDRVFPAWGWKDPRSVLFLEQWKALVPHLKVLAIWRPAADVVDSLLRRSRRTTNPDMRARAWPAVELWKAYNRLVVAYKLRHPSSTLLLSLDDILTHDEHVMTLIDGRFDAGLHHVPIASLYQQGLLGRAGTSRRLALLRVLTAHRGCTRLEDELCALSDRPVPAPGRQP